VVDSIQLQDWDVLYLHAAVGGTTSGRAVGPHLVAVRKTAGTIGYVATPAFARKALAAARNQRQNTWVDLIFTVSFYWQPGGTFWWHLNIKSLLYEPLRVAVGGIGCGLTVKVPLPAQGLQEWCVNV
jgi:hypothetical protein